MNLLHADSPSAAVVLVLECHSSMEPSEPNFLLKAEISPEPTGLKSVPEKQSQWQGTTLLESITHWECVWLPAENFDTTLASCSMDQKACSGCPITLRVHSPHRDSMGNLMQKSKKSSRCFHHELPQQSARAIGYQRIVPGGHRATDQTFTKEIFLHTRRYFGLQGFG